MWEFRELLYFLIWRDVEARYKQAVLGALFWVSARMAVLVLISGAFCFRRMERTFADTV